jgi:hypothetical protein
VEERIIHQSRYCNKHGREDNIQPDIVTIMEKRIIYSHVAVSNKEEKINIEPSYCNKHRREDKHRAMLL